MLNFDLKVLDSINQLICTFELTTERLGPGRYCSRFRICAAFVELHYLIATDTEPRSVWDSRVADFQLE